MLLHSKINFLFFLIVLHAGLVGSQPVRPVICISKSPVYPVTLSEFRGIKTIKTTVLQSKDDCMQIPEGYVGFIRISIGTHSTDLILEGKSQTIELYFDTDSNLLAKSDSPTQQLMEELKKNYIHLSEEIQKSIIKTEKERKLLQRKKIVDSLLSIYPESFFSKSTRLAMMDTKGLGYSSLLDSIPWKNPDYIHSSLIPKMIMNAIGAIGSPDEKTLFLLLDYLYAREMHPEVRELTNDFLVEFFTGTHADAALQYLLDKHVGTDYCPGNVSANAAKKMKQLELYQPGNKLPDVLVNGKKISRKTKRKKGKIAIVVWSTECSHCKNLLEKIENSKKHGYYVIGIEISGKHEKIIESVFSVSLQDDEGWEGELAEQWLIDRTPTLFIISHDLTLLSVPENPEKIFEP